MIFILIHFFDPQFGGDPIFYQTHLQESRVGSDPMPVTPSTRIASRPEVRGAPRGGGASGALEAPQPADRRGHGPGPAQGEDAPRCGSFGRSEGCGGLLRSAANAGLEMPYQRNGHPRIKRRLWPFGGGWFQAKPLLATILGRTGFSNRRTPLWLGWV